MNMWKQLCPSTEYIIITKYFGVGTYYIFTLILVLYLNYKFNLI